MSLEDFIITVYCLVDDTLKSIYGERLRKGDLIRDYLIVR